MKGYKSLLFSPIVLTLLLGLSPSPLEGKERVTYRQGNLALKGDLCRPEGAGPFPAVIYYHGGTQGQIGGAPRQTGFSSYRNVTVPIQGQLGDVMAALEYVKELENVDPHRIGIIGFSSGGHLALRLAARNPEIKAAVIFAPAPGGKGKGTARVLKEETRRSRHRFYFSLVKMTMLTSIVSSSPRNFTENFRPRATPPGL